MIESSVDNSRHFEIVTPTVATVTRNQFNCQELKGARLENQPTNPLDCFGSHWDEVSYLLLLLLLLLLYVSFLK